MRYLNSWIFWHARELDLSNLTYILHLFQGVYFKYLVQHLFYGMLMHLFQGRLVLILAICRAWGILTLKETTICLPKIWIGSQVSLLYSTYIVGGGGGVKINHTKADWLHAINMLPSLLELIFVHVNLNTFHLLLLSLISLLFMSLIYHTTHLKPPYLSGCLILWV